MYLEISGRQCGKTTRLVKQAEELLKTNAPMINLFIYNKSYLKHNPGIKELYNKYKNQIHVYTPEIVNRNIGCNTNDLYLYPTFWDEFDFYENIDSFAQYIKDTDYFVTTSKFKRDISTINIHKTDDFLIKLIIMNKGNVVHYYNMLKITDPIIRHHFKQESFEIEMLGQFLK